MNCVVVVISQKAIYHWGRLIGQLDALVPCQEVGRVRPMETLFCHVDLKLHEEEP